MKSVTVALRIALGMLWIVCFSTVDCQADDDIGRLLDKLKDMTFKQQFATVRDIHGHGKGAISVLIQRIDSREELSMGFKNPISSFLDPRELRPKTLGEVCAYLVELILARETLVWDPSDDVMGSLGNYPSNYVYDSGLIHRVDGKPLSADDLKGIKSVYMMWWSKTRDKPIRKLRRDWDNGIRPLSGSSFYWR